MESRILFLTSIGQRLAMAESGLLSGSIGWACDDVGATALHKQLTSGYSAHGIDDDRSIHRTIDNPSCPQPTHVGNLVTFFGEHQQCGLSPLQQRLDFRKRTQETCRQHQYVGIGLLQYSQQLFGRLGLPYDANVVRDRQYLRYPNMEKLLMVCSLLSSNTLKSFWVRSGT